MVLLQVLFQCACQINYCGEFGACNYYAVDRQ